MTFSLLLDIIEEIYNYDRTEDAEQLYYDCFDEKSDLLPYKDIQLNLKSWITDCLEIWEITNQNFIDSYITEIIYDDTKLRLLIEHIYHYCQPEGAPETSSDWIVQKKTKKNY